MSKIRISHGAAVSLLEILVLSLDLYTRTHRKSQFFIPATTEYSSKVDIYEVLTCRSVIMTQELAGRAGNADLEQLALRVCTAFHFEVLVYRMVHY